MRDFIRLGAAVLLVLSAVFGILALLTFTSDRYAWASQTVKYYSSRPDEVEVEGIEAELADAEAEVSASKRQGTLFALISAFGLCVLAACRFLVYNYPKKWGREDEKSRKN